MEAVTKQAAIDLLTLYGHVYLGNASKPLGEVVEACDNHADEHAERMAIFVKLRHATRTKGLRVWFPSLGGSGGESSIDLSGADTKVYTRGQYLIVHTHHKKGSNANFNTYHSTVYFLPALEPVA